MLTKQQPVETRLFSSLLQEYADKGIGGRVGRRPLVPSSANGVPGERPIIIPLWFFSMTSRPPLFRGITLPSTFFLSDRKLKLSFSYFRNSTRIHHFSPRNKIFRWNSNSWKFTNWSVKLWWQFYTNFSRIIPFLLNEVNRQTDLIKNEQKLENSIRYKNRLRLELLIDGKWWSRCKRRRGGFSPRILLEKLSQGLRSNWLGSTGVATSCLAVCPGRGVCGVCERWKWISARV